MEGGLDGRRRDRARRARRGRGMPGKKEMGKGDRLTGGARLSVRGGRGEGKLGRGMSASPIAFSSRLPKRLRLLAPPAASPIASAYLLAAARPLAARPLAPGSSAPSFLPSPRRRGRVVSAPQPAGFERAISNLAFERHLQPRGAATRGRCGLRRGLGCQPHAPDHRGLCAAATPTCHGPAWTLRCYSCGLFMLNYMEYWTGDKLSDNFTQADMTHFREKIAAILLSSDLNQRKGQPLYKKVDPKEKRDAVGSDPEVQIVGASSSPNKRIRLPDPKTVIFEDDAGPVTQELLQKWVDEEWSKPSTDGSADDKLMSGLSTIDMPPTKADLIDVVCDYIMEIKDHKTLKTVWVRSFNPYRIELSVLQLQQILKMSQDMTIPYFDMAVRLLAHKEQKKLENAKGKVNKHYMDLRFFKMSGFNKDPRWHKEPSKEELAKTLDSWPWMNYNVTSCRYVLMPWKNDGCYVLFVIDHANHVITIIGFTHTPDWCKKLPIKRYYEAIILISKKYRTAYRLKHFEWPHDVYKWEHIIRPNRPIDTKKYFLNAHIRKMNVYVSIPYIT
ncbi:hypothetical protein U9M48_036712 [Paspalum notatum var. saurae]|uniref:Ubiquitin-like protease family profile domain-containing protein n=1 Tax=Paspalum notatum var. saurae TaxID=547442 RepID=A0AAQ3UEJ6_PASNO